MKTYLEWLQEVEIDERSMNIGAKSSTPQANQAVILAGGAGCFAGDTLVKTQNGKKKIQDIVSGEIVESWNEETQQLEWNVVSEIKVFPPFKRMIRLTFDNGEEVICTEDHEFLIDGKWIQAKDL